MIVMSGNVDHDCLSMATASSMVIFGNSLLDSMALIYFWITFYLVFSFQLLYNPMIHGLCLLRLCLAVRK